MSSLSATQPFIDPFDDPFDDVPEVSPGRTSPLGLVGQGVLRRRRPRLAYAAVVVGGVLAIVVAQLMLSIALSNGAYEIESLQSTQKTLDRSNQALSEKLDGLTAPQSLAASAESLGMVANVDPAYLRLSDGAVLGTPTKATAASGSLTNGQPALVPNALTAGTAAATQKATDASTAAAGANTAAGAPPVSAATTPVPFEGELPSPTTK